MTSLPFIWLAVAPAGEAAGKVPSQFDIAGTMSLLTWGTFLVASIILYKIAWKPILRALDKREKDIRKALDEAEEARARTAGTVEEQKRLLAEAEARGRQIVEEARRSADALAAAADARSTERSRRLVAEATQEIEQQRRQAVESLRREAAALAVEAAGRILAERGAGAEGRSFTERMGRELGSDA